MMIFFDCFELLGKIPPYTYESRLPRLAPPTNLITPLHPKFTVSKNAVYFKKKVSKTLFYYYTVVRKLLNIETPMIILSYIEK